MGIEHQGLSPEEIALLEGDDLDGGLPAELDSERANAAALAQDATDATATAAAGEGKDESGETDPPAAAAPAVAAPPPAAAPTEAPAPAAEAAATAPAVAAAPAPAPVPFVPRYTTADIDAITARRDAAATRQEEAFAQLNDGTLEIAEYNRIKRETQAEMDQALIDRTLATANAQNEAQVQQQAQQTEAQLVEGLMTRAKAAGEVDYFTDQRAQKLFDWAMNAAQSDPDNEGKSLAQLMDVAHAQVLTRFGKAAAPAPAPAAETPAPTAAKIDPRSVDKSLIPPTLSRVPPAADASIAGDEFSHMAGLKGGDMEKAFAAMTPEQQERYLN